MAKQKTLQDLFFDGLKDIYYAERKALKANQKMARAAESDELRQAFENHVEQTHGQIERLQKMFELLEKRPQGKTCEAIDGIIAEGEEVMEEYKGTPAMEAGMIAAAQAVEHYEITRYGTMRRWAEVLGMKEAVPLIEQSLKEEEETDKLLTQLADKAANQKAAEAA